jgi:hypothetical protein
MRVGKMWETWLENAGVPTDPRASKPHERGQAVATIWNPLMLPSEASWELGKATLCS